MADNNNNNSNSNTSNHVDSSNNELQQQRQQPRQRRRRPGRGGGRNNEIIGRSNDETPTDSSSNSHTNNNAASSATTTAASSSSSSSLGLRPNAPWFLLAPSQTIRSTSSSSEAAATTTMGGLGGAVSSTVTDSGSNQQTTNDVTISNSTAVGKKSRSSRNRGRGKSGGGSGAGRGGVAIDNNGNNNINSNNNNNTNNNSNNNGQKKKKTNKPTTKKKYPWRRFIPQGTVDPITLENLQSLEYPPFALCADDPYIPVPVWPIVEEDEVNKNNNINNNKPDVEELNRQRLAEQWGTALVPTASDNNNDGSNKKPDIPLSERPLNLYDGQALAYYLVSQLQFIDPLNRRDLTRPELVNLDKYLTRHGFTDVQVTEAYDAKGITLSTAGSAATTAQGRADILQQMAQQLLNSLFTGHSVSSIRGGGGGDRNRGNNDDVATTSAQTRIQAESFSLQEQYVAMQRQEQQQQARIREAQQRQFQADNDGGTRRGGGLGDATFYGSAEEDGGIMIIDDDENPGLRGRGDFPALNGTAAVPIVDGGGRTVSPPRFNFFSSSRITDRYGTGTTPTGTAAFPPLSAPSNNNGGSGTNNTAATAGSDDANSNKKPTKASKTLSKITATVKKTSEEEQHRQWEARELARRKAMMSNLAFGVNPFVLDRSSQGLLAGQSPAAAGADATPPVSEEQLQRNRAFAEALGVKPKTQRHYKSGWSRPVDGAPSLDEYGNELDAALYPEILIAVARQRMPLLLKLEKKWKAFLMDDKAASLPLNPMDKPSRTFIHHYSDFWNLKTESFDPEPKRYVHCVKLPETRMPNPLLSVVATNWRGPLPDISRVHLSDVESQQQTAGQPSRSRELPPPPERVPLRLKARSTSPTGGVEGRYHRVTEKGGAGLIEANAPNAARSSALLGRGRPKLDLAPRTVPLDLPPYDPKEQLHDQDTAAAYDAAEDLRKREVRIAERRQKEREADERKRQALEKVFASDDEEESGRRDNRGRKVDDDDDKNDSDSDWGDEPQAVYDGSDDED